MSQHALIIIDLQNDYFEGGKLPLHNINTAAKNATKILEHTRQNEDLIIHVHHEFLNDEPPFLHRTPKERKFIKALLLLQVK